MACRCPAWDCPARARPGTATVLHPRPLRENRLRGGEVVRWCHHLTTSLPHHPFSTASIQLHRRIISHVDPDVDVRLAAEVPDESRPFEAPVVPLLIAADVAVVLGGQTPC